MWSAPHERLSSPRMLGSSTPRPPRSITIASGYCLARSSRAMTVTDVDARSESAPIWRYSVIAMQFGFLRAIAPIKILVGAERRRAAQFFIVDIEFVGLEYRIVIEAPPRQRKQIGSDAEEAAET